MQKVQSEAELSDQGASGTTRCPWIVPFSGLQHSDTSVCVCVCERICANLSSSQYVFMLMKVSQTKISVAPHEYVNSEMRTATLRRNLSLSGHIYTAIIRCFSFEDLASNNKQTRTTWCWKAVIYRSDKQKNKGILKKIWSNKNFFFLLPKLFPSRWSTSLNLMQKRQMVFVKNTEICILCLTESSHLSAENVSAMLQCVEQMETIPVTTVCSCHSLSRSHKLGDWRC